MEKIIRWLTLAYPLGTSRRQELTSILLGAGFVTFFLFVFRPFGMQRASSAESLRISAAFGAVTLGVTLIWIAANRLLIRYFNEERWYVWKELLKDLLFVATVGVANMLYSVWAFKAPLNWSVFFLWQKLTFLVGVFPTIFGVMGKQMRLMAMYATEAGAINEGMAQRHREASPDAQVMLEGDNNNETLRVHTQDLLYIAAADNYVQVFYRENGQVKQSMLRATLKKMEDALASFPFVFRCHRTYLVNLDQVEKVNGNAQGFRLKIKDLETELPVSRSLNQVIHQKL